MDEMKNIAMTRQLLAFACVTFVCVVCAAQPARIAVAPGQSLADVRDKVRAMSADEKKDGVEIVLAPGDYLLADGIEFTEKDSGVAGDSPIVWRSETPGAARIYGMVRMPPPAFSKVEAPALLARLPEEGRGKVYAADVSALFPGDIQQIEDAFDGAPRPPVPFIDGHLARLASYPNGDEWLTFYKCVDQGAPIPNQRKRFKGGAFVCENPRFDRWDFSKGVWLLGYFSHDWYEWSAKAVSYGAENGTNGVVRIGGDVNVPYGIMAQTSARMKGRRFRAFNLFEELDDPGEWWLDRERKILYIVPPGGRMTDATDVRLAISEKPLVVGSKLSNMRFEGLDFSYAYAGLVAFTDATNVVFADCRFSRTAQDYAMRIFGTSNIVSRCEFLQCGGGGVAMYGGDRKTFARSDSAIEGCRVHDFGIIKRTSAGVVLNGCGLSLRGCEVFNAPWDAVVYNGNDLMIESNDVHHVLTETGDAGAIYTGRDWTTQGNVLRYNFVHDIGKRADCDGGDSVAPGTKMMGMYFDDCDCGDEAYGNVFLNVPRGILIGGGREHPIRNNVFINCNLGLSMDCRGITWGNWNVPGGGWHLEGKAQELGYTKGIWAEKYPRLANIMNDHPREPLYNPIDGNVFIDCREVVVIEALSDKVNEKSPGIMSRLAPIRNNTVIYTKDAKTVPRQEFDPRIADGFRVLDHSGK